MRPSVCAVRRDPGASNSSFSLSVAWYVSGGAPTRSRGIAYSTSTAAVPGAMVIAPTVAACEPEPPPLLLPVLTVWNELRWHSKQS